MKPGIQPSGGSSRYTNLGAALEMVLLNLFWLRRARRAFGVPRFGGGDNFF